jgi:hypothetical protein
MASINKIKLDNTTLISVIGTEKYFDSTMKAVKHCMNYADFEKIKIITCIPFKSEEIECIHIKPITNIQYSYLMMYHLKDIVDTDFCLTIQSDGFIVDGKYWTNEFFEYDYIGAPWLDMKTKNRIGNGGFSLRSKKFLKVSSTLEYRADIQFQPNIKPGELVTPEDWFCCVYMYDEMIKNGIKFPSIDLAYQFSVEHPSFFKKFNRSKIETYKSFGFHGNFNTAGMNLL